MKVQRKPMTHWHPMTIKQLAASRDLGAKLDYLLAIKTNSSSLLIV